MILLVNGWSDDNKGDAAIVVGSVRALEAHITGQPLGLVSMLARSPLEVQQHHRHTAVYFTGGVFAPIVQMNESQGQSRRRRVGLRLFELVRSGLVLVIGPKWVGRLLPFLFNSSERKSLQAYAEASLVISKGGHFLLALGGARGALGLYCNALPLLIGRRAGARTMIYGQSIGPVRGVIGRWLLGYVLKQCDGILVREQRSYAVVEKLASGLSSKCKVCIDPAFHTPAEPIPEPLCRRLPSDFVALTIRQWRFVEQGPVGEAEGRYSRYIEAIGALIGFLKRECGVAVVLVAQVRGPTALENDFVAWEDLRRVVSVGDWPLEVREDLTPGQIRTLYGRARATIGTRFHSVILSLAAGTPSLAISYFGPKAIGIMEDLGLGEYAVDIADLSARELERRVKALLSDDGVLREQTQRAIAELSKESVLVLGDAVARLLNATEE